MTEGACFKISCIFSRLATDTSACVIHVQTPSTHVSIVNPYELPSPTDPRDLSEDFWVNYKRSRNRKRRCTGISECIGFRLRVYIGLFVTTTLRSTCGDTGSHVYARLSLFLALERALSPSPCEISVHCKLRGACELITRVNGGAHSSAFIPTYTSVYWLSAADTARRCACNSGSALHLAPMIIIMKEYYSLFRRLGVTRCPRWLAACAYRQENRATAYFISPQPPSPYTNLRNGRGALN